MAANHVVAMGEALSGLESKVVSSEERGRERVNASAEEVGGVARRELQTVASHLDSVIQEVTSNFTTYLTHYNTSMTERVELLNASLLEEV
jgi:hypothetical protein